jgi:hypothetical protein
MTNDAPDYDIFISYAREDGMWVREHLYQPLLSCRRTLDGRRPRIFFDVGEEGIAIGRVIMDTFMEAILHARKFVPVYSSHYFNKQMCLLELGKARQLDPWGEAARINPILIDPAAKVPFNIDHINYWDTSSPDWFKRLCEALQLEPVVEHHVLQFQDQPGDISVNHTFSPVRVVVTSNGKIVSSMEQISISAEIGHLEGTLVAKSENGVATFSDLSIGTAVSATRLVARADGHEAAYSEPFSITDSICAPPIDDTKLPEQQERVPYIPICGEALFFKKGAALAVIRPERVAIYDLESNLLSTPHAVELNTRLRLVKRQDDFIVLADWAGNVHILRSDGTHLSWNFGTERQGFTIPGDVAIAGEQIFIGFWNGTVWRMTWGEQRPVALLRNDAGVQALAVADERIYVCGFDGMLRVYSKARIVNSEMLEPVVHLLQKGDGFLLAVGEHKLYQIVLSRLLVLSEQFQLNGVAAVLGDVALPVVIDAQGKGIRFNNELALKASFHTTAGAVPISADEDGRYCVFENRDRTRTLMIDNRIVFSYQRGTLSVAPRADQFAIGDESGIRVLSPEALEQVLKG